jgi:predicted glycosyl hydrolase (DUF1957 family)
MKLNRKSQIIIFSSIAALTSSIVVSRNLIQPNSERFLKQVSAETAEKWEKELSLSTGQKERMQRKITAYATKKNKVILSGKSKTIKTELLQRLQQLENKEIEQILTGAQYNQYLHLLNRSIKGD